MAQIEQPQRCPISLAQFMENQAKGLETNQELIEQLYGGYVADCGWLIKILNPSVETQAEE